MSGFDEVVRTSQTLDRSRVESALDSLAEFENVASSELAQSTLWSLEYLSLLPEQASSLALGLCVPARPNLAAPGSTDDLRLRLEQAMTEEVSPLLQANAMALLIRIELTEQTRADAEEIDLDPVKQMIEEQLRVLRDQQASSLRLWEADAQAVLADIVRLGDPLYAIALLQLAQGQATPFYRQTARASIGHIVECDFAIETDGILDADTDEESFVLHGIELATLRQAAACYYDTVNSSQPFFELESDRVDLADQCEEPTEALPLLCVYEEAAAGPENPFLERSVAESEALFRSALGDPELQCDL